MQQLAKDKASRQYQEQMAYQRERDAVADAQYKQESERELALQLLKLGYNNEQIARTLGVSAPVQTAAATQTARQAAPVATAEVPAGEATLENNPTAYLESKYAELFAGANAAEKIWLKNVLYQLEMGQISADEAAAKLASL